VSKVGIRAEPVEKKACSARVEELAPETSATYESLR